MYEKGDSTYVDLHGGGFPLRAFKQGGVYHKNLFSMTGKNDGVCRNEGEDRRERVLE